MQRDSKHLLLIIISSCLQQSFSDPCMFLRLSWSSDHGKEDSFCDEYLCSIQSPEVSWCLKRSHDVSHLQQSESQRLLLQCSLLRHRLNPLHECQDLHQPQQVEIVSADTTTHSRVSCQSRAKKYRQIAASALSLFVLRIFTDNSDTAFSLNNLALLANRFYWWSYFHSNSPFLRSPLPFTAGNTPIPCHLGTALRVAIPV